MLKRATRLAHSSTASSYAIMRRARPYRGENPAPGRMFMESLTPRPELENSRKSNRRDRTGWLGREDSNLRMSGSKSVWDAEVPQPDATHTKLTVPHIDVGQKHGAGAVGYQLRHAQLHREVEHTQHNADTAHGRLRSVSRSEVGQSLNLPRRPAGTRPSAVRRMGKQ
jgi:hypothetical protein